MAMDRNQHQGLFGESFVQVLASAAGLVMGKPYPDVTGTDFTFGYPGELAGVIDPSIEVQVKSWSRSNAKWAAGHWKYRMERKHFNRLAGTGFALPRFLFLVIVPDDHKLYTRSEDDALTLSYCAYWVSLLEQDRVDEGQGGKVPVDVPASNILTADKLLELVETCTANRVSL